MIWGTDSVWYGSPQWQIEAMRRLEIPEDMQKKYGFAPLGGANSAVKQMIFGSNAARLYEYAAGLALRSAGAVVVLGEGGKLTTGTRGFVSRTSER